MNASDSGTIKSVLILTLQFFICNRLTEASPAVTLVPYELVLLLLGFLAKIKHSMIQYCS